MVSARAGAAGRGTSLPGPGRTALAALAGAGGLAREAGWIAAHLVTYPVGALPGSAARTQRRRGNGRDASQRGLLRLDPGVATRPILLVHGIVDNHSIFTRLDHVLRARGFATVAAHDYGLLTADVAQAAAALGETIWVLARATGHDRVHVVGHSLGGLLARWFVQKQGGDALVDTLVTLGTPHGGTELARLAPLVPVLPMARQLNPTSRVVRGLAEPAPGCRTRFVAFASDIDHLVVPARNARIEHPDLDATNVDVHGVGHLSMPNHRRLAYEIADLLATPPPYGGHEAGESVRKASGDAVPT
jgi:triacylglycerol lipase